MPQINQLPTRTPVAGDTVPFYSSNNGDAAKTSFTAIATLMTQLMGVSGGGGFITQYSQPTATAFTVTVGGIGQSTWLIVTPTAAGFSGTITFPDVSTVADQQELIISTTNDISLTYVATGMTVFGAPATLTAGSSAVFKYNLVSKFWYCISGSGSGGSVNSASFIAGGSNTVIPSGDAVPVFGGTDPDLAIKTGSGITVEMDGGEDYAIFTDLSASHAYSVVYSISVSGSEAARIEFGLVDAALAPIAGVTGISQDVTTGVSMCTYSATVTGETDIILSVGRLDSVDPVTVTSLGINARIVDLGIAV